MPGPLTFTDWPDGSEIAMRLRRSHNWDRALPTEITCVCRNVQDYHCGPPLRYDSVIGHGNREYDLSIKLVNVSWSNNDATLIYEVEAAPI
jgi:hypothetical protein